MCNWRVGCFTFNNKVYQAGTKVIYSGPCILNDNAIMVNNLAVNFMYYDGMYVFCKNGNTIYKFLGSDFDKNIVMVVADGNKSPPVTKEEFYWTDDMVINTIWYVIIMIISSLFYDRIGLWILATVIWYFSTFKKK